MTDRLGPHLPDALLNEYLDQALASAARGAVSAHLAACPDCSARLASLSAVFNGLAELPSAPLRRDLRAGVLAAARSQRPLALRPLADPGRRPVQLVIGLQLLAAIALLLLAWPFVAPLAGLDRVATLGLLGEAAANLTSAGLAASRAWPAVQSWLTSTTAWPLGTGLSPVAAGLVLAAAGLLWLLGNALLLRPGAAAVWRRNL